MAARPGTKHIVPPGGRRPLPTRFAGHLPLKGKAMPPLQHVHACILMRFETAPGRSLPVTGESQGCHVCANLEPRTIPPCLAPVRGAAAPGKQSSGLFSARPGREAPGSGARRAERGTPLPAAQDKPEGPSQSLCASSPRSRGEPRLPRVCANLESRAIPSPGRGCRPKASPSADGEVPAKRGIGHL